MNTNTECTCTLCNFGRREAAILGREWTERDERETHNPAKIVTGVLLNWQRNRPFPAQGK
jgi:hypothetical protein